MCSAQNFKMIEQLRNESQVTTKIYASVNQVSIGSANGLSPIQCQSIIQTNAGLLSIGPLGTDLNEIRIKIQNFSYMKMHLKISSAKWRPFCPGGEMS